MSVGRRIALAAGLTAAGLLCIGFSDVAAAPDTEIRADWQPWTHLPGVYDLVASAPAHGLVAAANDGLWSVDVRANLEKIDRGPTGFVLNGTTESYIAVVPQMHVSAGCDFIQGDTYVLAVQWPVGLIRVDASGRASRFVTFANIDTVNGITVDTTGSFGNRLLVTGVKKNKTVVLAVDCTAKVTTITEAGPPVEGGIQVAPANFGPFGGNLIAPDGDTDRVWAFAPDGSSRLIVRTGFATGVDTGIESLGFLPPGFIEQGGAAYVADRGSPGNAYPGTDTIWRYTSDALARAGVADGDLLLTAEGEGYTARVRCAATCNALLLGEAGNKSHMEGHIAFIRGRVATASGPSTALTASRPPTTQDLLGLTAFGVVSLGLSFWLLARRRAKRAH